MGLGNALTTDFRENDTRLGGRWWSLDKIVKPWESPYVGYANCPMVFIDPAGLDPSESAQSSTDTKTPSTDLSAIQTLPEVIISDKAPSSPPSLPPPNITGGSAEEETPTRIPMPDQSVPSQTSSTRVERSPGFEILSPRVSTPAKLSPRDKMLAEEAKLLHDHPYTAAFYVNNGYWGSPIQKAIEQGSNDAGIFFGSTVTLPYVIGEGVVFIPEAQDIALNTAARIYVAGANSVAWAGGFYGQYLFGGSSQGILNQNNWIRIGYGTNQGQTVFRIAFGAANPKFLNQVPQMLQPLNQWMRTLGSNGHIDLW